MTETLCGQSFSASAISGMNQTLAGATASQAVLVAVAVDGERRRQTLGVELANREGTSSRRDFLLGLKQRGPHGVGFVASDDHPGLRQAKSHGNGSTSVLP